MCTLGIAIGIFVLAKQGLRLGLDHGPPLIQSLSSQGQSRDALNGKLQSKREYFR
jgi:hypothetical protein